MKELLGISSFVLGVGITVPYMVDIVKGRAVPARSTRILFFILMIAIFTVQWREFTSWVLAYTAAQVVIQVLLLSLALKYGIGGFGVIDKITYTLFGVSIIAYLLSGDTFIGLFLLCTTDLVAFVPTIVKTWHDPKSETPLFFVGGAVASLMAVFAASNIYDLNETLFPIYLVIVDVLIVSLIYRFRIASFLQGSTPRAGRKN